MKVFSVVMLLVLAGMLGSPAEGNWIGDCWDTWSRCTRWSIGGSGTLWKTCNDRCRELGRSGGNCVLSTSNCPLSSKAYQCRCY